METLNDSPGVAQEICGGERKENKTGLPRSPTCPLTSSPSTSYAGWVSGRHCCHPALQHGLCTHPPLATLSIAGVRTRSKRVKESRKTKPCLLWGQHKAWTFTWLPWWLSAVEIHFKTQSGKPPARLPGTRMGLGPAGSAACMVLTLNTLGAACCHWKIFSAGGNRLHSGKLSCISPHSCLVCWLSPSENLRQCW